MRIVWGYKTEYPEPDMILIDGCQYANWSEKIFREINAGGVSAVHVTICYHEDFRETVENMADWNRMFERFPDLIVPGRTAEDVRRAHADGRTAIVFGFQNCSPIEDDIGLVEICHQLGARFMQLTYNNQSLLATGCYEENDTGVTRMGRQVIAEMNRVGLVVDMSHSGERSTLEAIEMSECPIAITHANPAFWHPAQRNKSDDVLKALGESGGMLGFSLYPHHLKDQPDSVVEWMRVGRWTKDIDYGEGSASDAGFPPMPSWFGGNLDFGNIADGLKAHGFDDADVEKVMGGNWLRFFEESFGPSN